MFRDLLRDNYTFTEAKKLQIKYLELIQNDSQKIYDFTDLIKIKWIIGVDISYFNKKDEEYGVACAVLWNFQENKLYDYYFSQDVIKFPYKAGFLGFRENKLLAQVINKSPQNSDLIMCDGHGMIHPRKFGEAIHLGLALNIPSFGIAKNPFIGYSEWKTLERKKGKKTPVCAINPKNKINSDNEILGYAICLSDGKKPVFVSAGYRTTLELALKIALKNSKGNRQPEALYLADQFSRLKVKKLKNQ